MTAPKPYRLTCTYGGMTMTHGWWIVSAGTGKRAGAIRRLGCSWDAWLSVGDGSKVRAVFRARTRTAAADAVWAAWVNR